MCNICDITATARWYVRYIWHGHEYDMDITSLQHNGMPMSHVATYYVICTMSYVTLCPCHMYIICRYMWHRHTMLQWCHMWHHCNCKIWHMQRHCNIICRIHIHTRTGAYECCTSHESCWRNMPHSGAYECSSYVVTHTYTHIHTPESRVMLT